MMSASEQDFNKIAARCGMPTTTAIIRSIDAYPILLPPNQIMHYGFELEVIGGVGFDGNNKGLLLGHTYDEGKQEKEGLVKLADLKVGDTIRTIVGPATCDTAIPDYHLGPIFLCGPAPSAPAANPGNKGSSPAP
jgi:hypothetical protein